MNCPRCKAELVDDARFCGNCGYSLSALQENGNGARANPSSLSPSNDEVTMMGSAWSGAQQQPLVQRVQEPPFLAQVPMNSAPTMRQASPSGQPGSFQLPQDGAWPQQGSQTSWPPQQPGSGWQAANQPQAYPQGMMPGTLNSSGIAAAPIRKRKSGGRILFRMLLSLVLLAAILAGAWFFGVRPYVHNMVQTQLNQALDGAEGQILLFQTALPQGSQIVTVDENTINNYLMSQDTSQIKNLHATIAPDSFRLDFSAYGFACAILAVPGASGGMLQVTNVQVQGVLGLVMSSDELTTTLNSNFQGFGQQMHRTIQKITLKEHEMDVIIN